MMKKWIVACCSVLVLGLVACGGKKVEAPQEDVPAASEETVADEQKDTNVISPDRETGEGDHSLSLSDMQKKLAGKTLQVSKSMSDPKARDFAQVFCKAFSSFGANALLLKYLKNPGAFDAKAENAKVVDDRPNGFVKCEKYALFDNQDDESFEACRWMRKNGHSLVGVFMHSSNDAGANEYAYAFYDYDPSTGIMKPDKDVLGRVADEIKQFRGDDLLIRLPQKGKDLELEFLELRDGDVYNSAISTLKWTGDGFN